MSAPAKMTQEDTYAYEEEQERLAMMKLNFQPMKKWYNHQLSLSTQHGGFPMFWQDLAQWTPYKDILKLYLVATEDPSSRTLEKQNKQDITIRDEISPTNPTSKRVRKRKSRWGEEIPDVDEPPKDDNGVQQNNPNSNAPVTTGTSSSFPTLEAKTNNKDQLPKVAKKSRWGSSGEKKNLSQDLTLKQQQLLSLRTQLEEVNRQIDPFKSLETLSSEKAKEKQALEYQKQVILDKLLRLNPLYRSSTSSNVQVTGGRMGNGDKASSAQKFTRKIYIPIKEFPNYNFIGLIIGPRGNTQKRMEKDSNCKIAIRGRGSVKEGSRGKSKSAKIMAGSGSGSHYGSSTNKPDEDDELHVFVIGENAADLEKGCELVTELLVPQDDTTNEHKQKQLRELALINGTLREDDFCHICGGKGHRQFECPSRETNVSKVQVTCAICGDSSHPTRDCTQKNKTAEERQAINQEYLNFMEQLGEKGSSIIKPKEASGAPVTSGASTTVAPWLTATSTSTSTSTSTTSTQNLTPTPPAPTTSQPVSTAQTNYYAQYQHQQAYQQAYQGYYANNPTQAQAPSGYYADPNYYQQQYYAQAGYPAPAAGASSYDPAAAAAASVAPPTEAAPANPVETVEPPATESESTPATNYEDFLHSLY